MRASSLRNARFFFLENESSMAIGGAEIVTGKLWETRRPVAVCDTILKDSYTLSRVRDAVKTRGIRATTHTHTHTVFPLCADGIRSRALLRSFLSAPPRD